MKKKIPVSDNTVDRYKKSNKRLFVKYTIKKETSLIGNKG